MSRLQNDTWEKLVAAGVTAGAPPEGGEAESPWFVKCLLAFSGWFAAWFLLGFFAIGLEFLLENTPALLVVGGLMMGGAYGLLRAPKNEFFEHLALAVSLAGQGLLICGLHELAHEALPATCLLVATLQVVLAWVMPSFVHRVYSAFFGAVALYMALVLWGWPDLVTGAVLLGAAWSWLNEFSFPVHMKRIRAVGYGLVLALVFLQGVHASGMRGMGVGQAGDPPALWIEDVLVAAVGLYVVWQLLRRYGRELRDPLAVVALLGTGLIGFASLEAPGIAVAMVILALGFAGSNRVLMGLGIVSLFYYTSSYYYLLEVTLLGKSRSLLVIGLLLLALRWLLGRMIAAMEVKDA